MMAYRYMLCGPDPDKTLEFDDGELTPDELEDRALYAGLELPVHVWRDRISYTTIYPHK